MKLYLTPQQAQLWLFFQVLNLIWCSIFNRAVCFFRVIWKVRDQVLLISKCPLILRNALSRESHRGFNSRRRWFWEGLNGWKNKDLILGSPHLSSPKGSSGSQRQTLMWLSCQSFLKAQMSFPPESFWKAQKADTFSRFCFGKSPSRVGLVCFS